MVIYSLIDSAQGATGFLKQFANAGQIAGVAPVAAAGLVEVAVVAAEVIPEWATAVIQMEEQQLDWIVANLSLVGGAVES